jgi:DNA replication and repair protein RecF
VHIDGGPVEYRGLHDLHITDFRNIAAASLTFSPGLNLITGANASGKTSLLEAIYTLGRVRSFRTNRPEQAIRRGQSFYRLVGQVGDQSGGRLPVGIERHPDSVEVHLDRQPLRRLSELAGCLPVQVLSADTPTILNGGPGQRRQTLDWAMFHVEHEYRDLWQRYNRVLKQRNAALRAQLPDREVVSWNHDLIELAGNIDQLRRGYLSEFAALLGMELLELLPGHEVELRYLPGWPGNSILEDALEKGLVRDRQAGYTHYGVHRADFRLLVDGSEILEVCSRGQQKTVLVAFMLAQMRLQQLRNKPVGAFLLDDLGSELDAANRVRVMAALRELSAQLFVTMIEDGSFQMPAWENLHRFHVEHGVIQEML